MGTFSQTITDPQISWHAWSRMVERGITPAQVEKVLNHGRRIENADARIHTVWGNEIDYCRRRGINIADCKGIHVVCDFDGQIMTVYRKYDLFNQPWRPGWERNRRADNGRMRP